MKGVRFDENVLSIVDEIEMLAHRMRIYLVTIANCVGLIPFICNYTYPNNAYVPMSGFLFRKIQGGGKKWTKIELSSVWSTLVSLGFVGSAFSFFFGPFLSDRIGRRKTIILCTLLAIPPRLASFASPLWPSLWPALFVGQFLSCFFAGIISQVLPVAICEMAEAEVRGQLGMSLVATYSVSLLFSAVLGLEEVLGTSELWHYAYLIFLILGCLPIPFLFWMRETPAYLAAKGNHSAMIDSLEFYRGSSIDSARVKADAEHSEPTHKGRFSRFRVVRFVMDRNLRRPIGLTMVVSLNCVLMDFIQAFSTLFFLKAGMSNPQATWATLAMRIVVVAMTFTFVFLAPILSGRAHFLSGTWAASIAMLSLTLFQVIYDSTGQFVFTIFFAIAIVTQQAGASFGVRPQFWFLVAEMFPHHLRSTAKAFSLLCLSIGGAAASSIIVPLFEVIKGWAYLPLGIIAGLLALYTHLYLPETRGKDLSQIYQDFDDNEKKRKRNQRPPSLYRELTESQDSIRADDEASALLPTQFFDNNARLT